MSKIVYAGLNLETALAESRFSRARFLQATNEPPQILTMRCYTCEVHTQLVDLRADSQVHNPDSFAYAQAIGRQLKAQNEMGILYQSVRYVGGECIAALRPKALTPPAIQAGHYQFYWDGNLITHVLAVTQAFSIWFLSAIGWSRRRSVDLNFIGAMIGLVEFILITSIMFSLLRFILKRVSLAFPL